MKEIIPLEIIEQKIFLIRGHRVMLDKDLAELYEVTTGKQSCFQEYGKFPARLYVPAFGEGV